MAQDTKTYTLLKPHYVRAGRVQLQLQPGDTIELTDVQAHKLRDRVVPVETEADVKDS